MFTSEERGVYGGEGRMDGWARGAGSSIERSEAEEMAMKEPRREV